MTQRFLGAGLALFGLAIVYLSLQLPAPIAATRIQYGAGFFPIILGSVIAIAGALLAVAKTALVHEEEGDRYALRDFGKPLVVLIAALIYVFFSQQIGFLLLAPVILTGLLLLGRVGWLQALAIGIIGSVVIYIVFAKFLLVPLPLGLLTPWSGWI
ncbi:tripartite tricarboxylate transporter TctB family protein [Pelagibacterium luteolum]|uniref:Tripartite tricarboxylate transporter TctB family protein n=1 Tax=Pelagibacterium luteolum TaxID=440168 RepID=A0A1G7RX99_9HYPH|nr:tripartite tricarboxylate transporter TctB family protein [Pelagibacterium luteolum]SDG15395.1 Tripartite tricarboxylate transporter TctB family protein [Pelagibacterium luteolum]